MDCVEDWRFELVVLAAVDYEVFFVAEETGVTAGEG